MKECHNCKSELGTEPHECPYASEINDDLTLCNCCENCEQQCCDDI